MKIPFRFGELWRRNRSDGSRERGGVRPPWLGMVLFALVATFSFSPGLTLRLARFEPGKIAPRDVVAPHDLIVPDPETTAAKRSEAAAAVLPVYDYDSGAAAHVEQVLAQAFRAARADLRGGLRKPEEARKNDFGIPISDDAFRALSRLHFSEDLERRLWTIAAQLYSRGVVDNKELLVQSRDRGVTLRDTDSGRERRTLDLFSTVEYGSDLKSAIALALASTSLKLPESREVAVFLASIMKPNWSYDAAETSARRRQAAASVESAFVKIPRGEVIVRRGDPVTARTARLAALVEGSGPGGEELPKLGAVALVQVLSLLLFWLDSEVRRRSTPREPSPLTPLLAAGIVFAVFDRLAFGVARSVAANLPPDAFGSSFLAIPFAAGPVLAVLIAGAGPGPAVLIASILAVDAGILMGMSFPFAIYALAGSLAGIYGMKRLRSRSVLLWLGAIVGAANLLAVVVLHASGTVESGLLSDAVGAAAGGMLVSALVAFLLPLFENFFHVVTDIRLLELSNQNLPLLRELAIEAPGTYQHSLMVGHIAEAGAEAIGANPLLARVCAYYHDIGKTKMPDYFIENQPRGHNRHDRLEPSMSALIIASHVKEGVEFARKSRLPAPIVAGIREHHGTKLIRYFYQKALAKAAPGSGPVPEAEYRYPGPKPSSRVNGILMIADAVEAASRTLYEPTPAKIASMVKAIVNDCLRDGQFDDCDLTMRDLSLAMEAVTRTVATMYHHRIDYPGFDFNREKSGARSSRRSSGSFRIETG